MFLSLALLDCLKRERGFNFSTEGLSTGNHAKYDISTDQYASKIFRKHYVFHPVFSNENNTFDSFKKTLNNWKYMVKVDM